MPKEERKAGGTPAATRPDDVVLKDENGVPRTGEGPMAQTLEPYLGPEEIEQMMNEDDVDSADVIKPGTVMMRKMLAEADAPEPNVAVPGLPGLSELPTGGTPVATVATNGKSNGRPTRTWEEYVAKLPKLTPTDADEHTDPSILERYPELVGRKSFKFVAHLYPRMLFMVRIPKRDPVSGGVARDPFGAELFDEFEIKFASGECIIDKRFGPQCRQIVCAVLDNPMFGGRGENANVREDCTAPRFWLEREPQYIIKLIGERVKHYTNYNPNAAEEVAEQNEAAAV